MERLVAIWRDVIGRLHHCVGFLYRGKLLNSRQWFWGSFIPGMMNRSEKRFPRPN
jgi:hypothetical protein